MKGKLTLVLGGSRSGKSEFAEKIAESSGKNIIYIATAAVRDEEMAERVKLHRERRPKDWFTVEEEKDVLGVLSRGGKGDVFLLDCATIWLTNLLFNGQCSEHEPVVSGAKILEEVVRLAETVENGLDLIIVSNEVGLGIIPEHPLGRLFRDLAGKANQVLAAKADSVYLVVAGIPLEIKSQPQN
ncbi:bifunctional adenosylcobinamide kinase/adenosylcobinamide-phosphate guanylyltransferase [Pelotomaculum propionicicum]|uniref:bifunctional adenosylcobinamide kinase/adenosylcobinamide-phosphate guanylyltransferase n=1 Tax=Pelotomaculum propionicicum TaxID=258475 RepID=UPI003B7F1DC1